MDIVLNGKQENCPPCTIAELVAAKRLSPEALVVELNGRIIGQEQWPAIRLKAHDALELLNFVGGG